MSLVINHLYAADNSCDQCSTEPATQILLVKAPGEWMIRALCDEDYLAFLEGATKAGQETKTFPIREIERAYNFMETESPYYAGTRFKER